MKKLLLYILCLCSSNLIAQTCLENGILFMNQTEIDNFSANYPNCTQVLGDLVVGNDMTITNVDGLSQITTIGGKLRVSSATISNLQGFSNLINVDGDLEIHFCNSLTNLQGLNNLETVGGELSISNNQNLLNTGGLENLVSVGGLLGIIYNNFLTTIIDLNNLTTVGRSLLIDNNASLTVIEAFEKLSVVPEIFRVQSNDKLVDLSSFSSITTVEGDLEIERNDELVNLEGLNNIISVGGSLVISRNEKLLTSNGLNGLKTIDGDFNLFENEVLENLDGFKGLTSIGGSLSLNSHEKLNNLEGLSNLKELGNRFISIYDNLELQKLKGLDNINPNSISSVNISNNPLLSVCEVKSICDYLEISNGLNDLIDDNAQGCGDSDEIKLACSVVNSIGKLNISPVYFYPNPTSGITQLPDLQSYEIHIFDLLGNQLNIERVNNGTITLSNYPDGVYIVELVKANQRFFSKIMKKEN